ncbi:cytidylyltransferase domain-containing protein [Succinivibrio dextrinosolvens]|uniref:cytidylyltransferase domain-containing protein n=1 Tax=Succinivibrio dextrinosolvens TaxID=83771 RepID=UPI0019228513|nr:NTP transferase domain-containing protein [Succinivibrio dextrinosolvens]
MNIIGIIPARYGSTRLPGKPLKNILGNPMIWWGYDRVKKVKKLDSVLVATDYKRIESACFEMQIPVVMTSNKHHAAANRLQEVSESIKADFYLQLNGDEPLINTEAIEKAIPEYIPQDVEFGTNIMAQYK